MKKTFLIGLLLFSCLLKAEIRDPQTQSFKVYPKIIMQEGSDFSDIEDSYHTSRRDVRRQFIYDYRSLYYSYSPYELLSIFDGMYDRHKEMASRNFSLSFESSLRSELDRISDFYHVPLKRLNFSFDARQNLDFFLLGIYSHLGRGIFRVSVTFLKLPSGDTQTFEASDYPDRVHALLAQKIFQYFYGNRYAPYENPQAQIQFLLPAPMHQGKLVDASDAHNYCSALGARLPFVKELALARAMGPYHAGGMDLIGNVYYLVADQTYWPEQYFYFNGNIEPINKMRTGAGMGNLQGAYFCVRGAPNTAIKTENELWQNLRALRASVNSYNWSKNPAINKIECELKKLGTAMYLYNQNACQNF